MYRKIMSLGIVLLLYSHSSAQAPDTLWTEIYGPKEWNEPTRILQTADDGYIVSGFSKWYATPRSTDIWVLKTDQEGNIQWEKLYGGSEYDYGESVLITGDGGYLISATTFSSGCSDILFFKIDDIGDVEWEVLFALNEEDWVDESQHTADGGYIHAGATGDYSNMDCLLVKTDSECNTEWYATFDEREVESFRFVKQTTDGGYIATGRTRSSSGPPYDVYVVKTDSIGKLEWDALYANSDWDSPKAIHQTQDSGYIILSLTRIGSENRQWLIKIDSAGNIEWELISVSGEGRGNNLELASDGGFLISGSKSASLWLCKTDSIGNIEWETTVESSESAQGKYLQQTSDGGWIVAATQNPPPGHLYLWLVKFGPALGITESSQPVSDVLIRTVSPNPFSSSIGISYFIPQHGQVDLSVYDLNGRLVENLKNSSVSAGEHTFMWNPDPSLPSSCYMVVLESCGERSVRRCVKL